MSERSDRALEAVRADRLVIYSGALSMLFLDDQAYPFKTNPHFKAWAPILDNPDCFIVYSPGTRPILLFHQPVDYWYKPPALPTEFWVEHFDLRPIASLRSILVYAKNPSVHVRPATISIYSYPRNLPMSRPKKNRKTQPTTPPNRRDQILADFATLRIREADIPSRSKIVEQERGRLYW